MSTQLTSGPFPFLDLLQVGQARLLFDHLQKHNPPLDQLIYAPGGGEKCEAKPWGFEQFSLLDPDGELDVSPSLSLRRRAGHLETFLGAFYIY